MRFVIDAQLPPALSEFLIEQGYFSEHVTSIGLSIASDRNIWDYAQKNGSVIVSKDEDFIVMHTLDPSGPCVAWVRLGNCTKAVLLDQFNSVLPILIAKLENGERLVEIR